MNETLLSIVKSWCTVESGENTIDELRAWIQQLNDNTKVDIQKISLSDSSPWFYDPEEGCIRNMNRSFFTIVGCQWQTEDGPAAYQPVMLQEEIGLLGIICQEIGGVMHFLMQAKIEPGNVNKIQISPTLQATKSNFTRKHGGNKPPYLDYFLNASDYELIVDQLQSEQSSRFIGKRNRNILIRVEKYVPVFPSYRWMTLGQIKYFMRQDNLVNMDTRTVLSCIPYYKLAPLPGTLWRYFSNQALYHSVWNTVEDNRLPEIYHHINNYKMLSGFHRKIIPLHQLPGWNFRGNEFLSERSHPYKVIFCDIVIDGREVRQWTQPLFEANGAAVFGLLCCEESGILRFLVKAKPEPGCFDQIELGPTVQFESTETERDSDAITRFFMEQVACKRGIVFDQLLSEEGGRFYHEQNRNIVLKANREELPALPKGYFLLDYQTLNKLVQVNNILNIQLRNLLAVLEA